MPRRNTYILFCIALATMLCSLGAFFFMFHQIKAKNEAASVLSQSVDDKMTAQSNVAALKKMIDDTKQKRETLRSYVVDEDSVDTFIGFVEDQGGAAGVPVTVTSVVLSPSKPHTVSIALSAHGSFASVSRLVGLIEYSPYEVHITKINLNKVIDPVSAAQAAPGAKAASPKDSGWQLDMGFDVVSSTFTTKI